MLYSLTPCYILSAPLRHALMIHTGEPIFMPFHDVTGPEAVKPQL